MYIKEINYLLSILQHGSISKAAEELYITQPALSKFLRNVEKQMGAPLFSRQGNELVPTYVGSRYLEYARKIANLQEDWNLEYSDLAGEEHGRMSLMMPPMRNLCLAPYTLAPFWRKYPNIQVITLEQSSLVQKYLLERRDIDFVIQSDTEPSSSMVHEPLGSEEVVLLMSPDHPLANCGVEKPGCKYPWFDLRLAKNASFVLNPQTQTTGKVSWKLLEEAGIVPNILMQTHTTGVAMQIAASGFALAFSPETYTRTLPAGTRPLCFSVGKPQSKITLYAVHQHNRYLPSYIIYYWELIRSYMEESYSYKPDLPAAGTSFTALV